VARATHPKIIEDFLSRLQVAAAYRIEADNRHCEAFVADDTNTGVTEEILEFG